MRITCPGCGAQYEVAKGAIPPQGREVQCSACGHVWLVPGIESAVDAPPEPLPSAPDSTPEPEPAPEPAPEPEHAPEPEPEPPPEPATQTLPRRPALSPEVAAILREEAERERARREAERAAQQIGVQPDLGLDAGPKRPARATPARATPARVAPASDTAADTTVDTAAAASMPPAQTQPDSPPPAPDQVPVPRRRRSRLPDIEEINASLRAATERAPTHVGAAADARPAGRGFRAGFLSVLVVMLVAVGAYVGAPRIAQSIPATQPVLDRYVAGVDEWRLWLDLQVQALLPAENGRAP